MAYEQLSRDAMAARVARDIPEGASAARWTSHQNRSTHERRLHLRRGPHAYRPLGGALASVRADEIDLTIAGGVESMSRAPFVMPKADSGFSGDTAIYDTTIGWRFVNPRMKAMYGTDAMPETAENVATDHGISRDEHPRETTLEALGRLKGVVRTDGTVTAGNASGVNDGAAAVLRASASRRA